MSVFCNIPQKGICLHSANIKKTSCHHLLRKTTLELCYVDSHGNRGQWHPNKWPLFINSWAPSVKAVLLHDGNKHVSEHRPHIIQMKYSYLMHVLVKHIQFDKYLLACQSFALSWLIYKWYIQHSGVYCEWDKQQKNHLSQQQSSHINYTSPHPSHPREREGGERPPVNVWLLQFHFLLTTTY